MAATGITVTVAVLVLFVMTGSTFALVTVAVFATGPVVGGRVTIREIVAVPAFATVPSEQVTVVVPLQVPWLGVTETNVVPAGSTSVTTTFSAAFGPASPTVIV